MTTKIGWGFIGASTIAREWMIGAVRAQPDQDIVAVHSTNPQRGAAFAKEHNIAQHYNDLDAMLANSAVHSVYISTTNQLHKEQTLAAARAGKHVLCEKPLALTVADAKLMAKACVDAGVVMATNHHLRCAATHRKVRDLLREGAIGKPLYARVFHAVYLPPHLQGWRLDQPSAGGGLVLDITVHDVDTLRFLFDAEPTEVIALNQHSGMAKAELEDGNMAVMRFDNGVLVQLHDAFTIKYAGTGLEIHGTEGSIVARDVLTQRPIGRIFVRDANGEKEIPVDHENLYVRAVAQFTRAVQGQGAPAATAEDGIRSLTTALAVLDSARTGKRVAVSFN